MLAPSLAVEDALEVLRRQQRVDGDAVGDAEEADLGAVEVLLDDHPLAGGGVVERLLPVVGDHDSLAGGQTVVLDDVRRAELVERGGDLVGRRPGVGSRGRDTGCCHDLLGEGLGPLEHRRLPGRAEAGDADAADGVRDAGDQGRLGADDDEPDAEVARQGGDRCTVHRVDVVQGRERGHAGVARCGVHLLHLGIGGQGVHQGVLAPAGADHEDVHAGHPSHPRREVTLVIGSLRGRPWSVERARKHRPETISDVSKNHQ